MARMGTKYVNGTRRCVDGLKAYGEEKRGTKRGSQQLDRCLMPCAEDGGDEGWRRGNKSPGCLFGEGDEFGKLISLRAEGSSARSVRRN